MTNISPANARPRPIAAQSGSSMPPATATKIHKIVAEVPITKNCGRLSRASRAITPSRRLIGSVNVRPTTKIYTPENASSPASEPTFAGSARSEPAIET